MYEHAWRGVCWGRIFAYKKINNKISIVMTL